MRLSLLISIALAVVLAGAGASAKKSPAEIKKAKTAFKAAQKLLRAEQYAQAIVEFKKAYKITEDGLVMGQVALAYEKAGDYESALESIRVYREALPPSDRTSVNALVKRYERMILEGKSQRLYLPGEQAQPAPEQLSEQKQPNQQPEDNAQANSEDEKPEKAKKGKLLWTWVAAGTAVALGVSSLVVGLSAQSKFDELDSRCGPEAGGTCAQDDIDAVDARAIATDVLWGTALAAGVAAGILYFVERPKAKKATSEEDYLPEDEGEDEEEFDETVDDGLVRNFRLSPVAGMGTVGLSAAIDY